MAVPTNPKSFDSTLAESRVHDFVVTRDIDPSDRPSYSSILDRVQSEQAKNSFSGVSAQFGVEVAEKLKQFQELTFALGQANEAYAANRYLMDMQEEESSRLNRYNAMAKTQVYKAQHVKRSLVYDTRYFQVLSMVTLLSLITVCVLIVIETARQDGMYAWLAAVLAVVTVLLYGLIVGNILRALMRARPNNWGQQYHDHNFDKRASGCQKKQR